MWRRGEEEGEEEEEEEERRRRREGEGERREGGGGRGEGRGDEWCSHSRRKQLQSRVNSPKIHFEGRGLFNVLLDWALRHHALPCAFCLGPGVYQGLTGLRSSIEHLRRHCIEMCDRASRRSHVMRSAPRVLMRVMRRGGGGLQDDLASRQGEVPNGSMELLRS